MINQAFWLVLTVASFVCALDQANCTIRSFTWVFNSLGQSPCYVAEQLADVCNPGGVVSTLPKLDSGSLYLGPNQNETNSCQCSSVLYSLVSACAACQGGDWLKWSDFSKNCSRAWVSTYLNSIPPNTTVPQYAYLNVSAKDGFDLKDAYQIAKSGSSSHSSEAGRIAGGIIACIAGLIIAGATLFWLHQRRRKLVTDRLRNRSSRNYVPLSDPPTAAWTITTVPQPAYQPEKRHDFGIYPPRSSDGFP